MFATKKKKKKKTDTIIIIFRAIKAPSAWLSCSLEDVTTFTAPRSRARQVDITAAEESALCRRFVSLQPRPSQEQTSESSEH